MKIKFLISLSLYALLAFASGCSSQLDGVEEIVTDVQEDVYLSLDIAQADTRGVVTGTEFEEGAEIRIIVASVERPGEYYFDTKATYNGKDWVIAERVNLSQYRRQGINDYYVKAVYPYDKTGDYNVTADNIYITTALDQTDVMMGNSEVVNREHPMARIVFKHVLSRVTLRVGNTTGEKYISNITISEMPNRPGYLSDRETVDFSGDTAWNLYWLYPDSNVKSISVPCSVSLSPGQTKYVDILLAPTYGLYDYWVTESGVTRGGLDFSMTVDGEPVKFAIETPNWYPGHQYTYGITLP